MTEQLEEATDFEDYLSDDLIGYVAETNDKIYTVTKTVEELNELATVLGQYVNKKGTAKEPKLNEIIEEIGDVVLRLSILVRPEVGIFGDDAELQIEDRINFKLSKYFKFIKEGKYVGKI